MQLVFDTRCCPCRTENSECELTNEDCFIDEVADVCPFIKNGTPIPKGHGRLIDGDYLYKRFKANKCPDENVYRLIREEPTIIEANRRT